MCSGAPLCVFVLALGIPAISAAAEHFGQVTFAGLPVPGVTVSASLGGQQVETSTDQQGVYRFGNLSDGTWTIRVEMAGFSMQSRDVGIGPDAAPATWELTLLPLEQIVRLKPDTAVASANAPNGANLSNGPNENVPNNPNENDPNDPNDPNDLGLGAADGFLINGSVNNGAASPFAQLPAFGNNRRGPRSLYTGGIGMIAGDSAWDARPFSFTSQQTPKPDYTDLQMLATFGGPLRIPRLVRNGPNLFAGYQRSADTNATTQSALMPTLLERSGDFSRTLDPFGRPVRIVDPSTGLPFPGNRIPRDRISPQAAALLGYYPPPNVDGAGRYNYQVPLVAATRQDSVQSRLTQTLSPRSQLFGTFSYQRTATDARSLFGFEDSNEVSGIDTAATWSRRFSQFFTLRLRYQFTRLTTDVTPHFANRANVSGDAGIAGNNQDAVNWGPPSLIFASGIAGVSDVQHALTRNQTNGVSAEHFLGRGRHNFSFGGGVRRHAIDIESQQDPRGTFAFTGAATGSDLADFVLGIPQTSSIAFGNPDKYFRSSSYDAYVTDDWRLSPGLTVNAGMRWEYESPISERFGRLVNLDVAPGFGAISAVVASNPVGPLTSRRYPDSLLRPDWRGFQPRLGLAWRPVPGSSLVVRAGYGIYRNTSVYQSIATLLAQQPPLSTTFSVENTAAHPLTLASGFLVIPGVTANTFAVDPDFRVGSAQNWQASVQRDLPASLTVVASYLGAKGSDLMQQFLPNTYPSGAVNPCPLCPSGFIYLTSAGSSSRHAGQVQVRRRLRNGLTASVQYTLSRAVDDAAAFGGASVSGASIAQDWLSLDAERAPSNFDQRHLLNVQFQYTTGVGVGGGTLLDGVRGALFKGWTVSSQLTAGSGLPLTPLYLAPVRGTGVTGTIRADVIGDPGNAPAGYYVNPAAYAPPAPGRWGTAGRNSITGPAQFALNAGVARTFPWGDRLNLDWRIDATNVLNRVTYSGVNTIVGSPQFGLPNRANPMRKLQTTVRLRF